MAKGIWVAVVGPSGAGKDTVLSALRKILAGDGRFHFARRVISRAADAGGEDHEAVQEAELSMADLVLRWEAHGLHYGIRRAEVGQAPVTLLNLSRRVLAEAATLNRLVVVEVTAPRSVLAARLAARGRETAEEIIRRLDRAAPLPPDLRVVRLINDGPVEVAVATLRGLLNSLAEGRGWGREGAGHLRQDPFSAMTPPPAGEPRR
jgi:phosphonate metabolism protein PhnN/1,5-bisphosphokinase (PRPP-forming)